MLASFLLADAVDTFERIGILVAIVLGGGIGLYYGFRQSKKKKEDERDQKSNSCQS